jgi:hypothetical protein
MAKKQRTPKLKPWIEAKDPGDPRNIPDEPVRTSNRRFYPDTDPNSPPGLGNTAAGRHSPSGFNLDRPETGDPVDENATAYLVLVRYCKWMVEVVGADGFRLDAGLAARCIHIRVAGRTGA